MKAAFASYEQNSGHLCATPSSDKFVKLQVPDGEGGGGQLRAGGEIAG
jgi:hypothetical protein